MKYKEERPLADLDAAVKKLLEIANGMEADHAGRLQTGAINAQFLSAGGNVQDYMSAVRAAIDRGYVTVHPSGAYLSFTQAGADLIGPGSAPVPDGAFAWNALRHELTALSFESNSGQRVASCVDPNSPPRSCRLAMIRTCILCWTISVAASDNPGGRLTSDIPISKPSLSICSRASCTATRFASSPSTQQKAGRAMSPKRWPRY